MVAILAAILEKKVDEDTPGTGPMLHRENRVKIRCRLGGEGGRTHTHTHTHTGLRKVSRIYPQWTLTSHEWLCGNKHPHYIHSLMLGTQKAQIVLVDYMYKHGSAHRYLW